jgi:putative SOS response-associated peptidase YedK
MCDDRPMCGRLTQQTDPAEVARVFGAELDETATADDRGPRYNVAPTDPLRAVVGRSEGRLVEIHRWGLVPSWEKAPSTSGRLINARLETVATTPAFRDSFARRRCIIPADAFYEWRRDGKRRAPFLIHAADESLLAFAGLWSAWRDPATARWLLSCAVITGPANESVGQLHDRIPVMLAADQWSAWLDPTISDGGLLQALLASARAPDLELYPVAPRVNDPNNEGADLILPLEAKAPLTLFS